MDARFVAAAMAMLLLPAIARAQAPAAPMRSIAAEPLPPLSPAARPAPETTATDAAAASARLSAPAGRVFCEQPVAVQLADRDAVPERYRPFVGIWSDAAWSPLLCAALIVSNVSPDGTASIVYVYGPMAANARGGGVLHGTGLIRNGELKFQNADGSQFAFRLLYADLDGHLTTPQRQNYQAVFKKTP